MLLLLAENNYVLRITSEVLPKDKNEIVSQWLHKSFRVQSFSPWVLRVLIPPRSFSPPIPSHPIPSRSGPLPSSRAGVWRLTCAPSHRKARSAPGRCSPGESQDRLLNDYHFSWVYFPTCSICQTVSDFTFLAFLCLLWVGDRRCFILRLFHSDWPLLTLLWTLSER